MGLFIGRYVVNNVRKGRKPTPTVTSQNMTPTIYDFMWYVLFLRRKWYVDSNAESRERANKYPR